MKAYCLIIVLIALTACATSKKVEHTRTVEHVERLKSIPISIPGYALSASLSIQPNAAGHIEPQSVQVSDGRNTLNLAVDSTGTVTASSTAPARVDSVQVIESTTTTTETNTSTKKTRPWSLTALFAVILSIFFILKFKN